MGLLIEGVWHDEDPEAKSRDGRFVRRESRFRDRVAADGAGGVPAEAGRYHLYVSYACPWAHRTLIVRALKGLEEAVTVAPVHWHMGAKGWRFTEDYPDPVNGASYLSEVYREARPDYTGRVTVPVLWDKHTGTIVNNESAEIIRMLNAEFDAHAKNPDLDLYPAELRQEIDAVNARVYEAVNNGVYRCGFATRQAAYEEAFDELFETLDWLEARLARRRYLAGRRFTEADVRLFTTLIRFDPVYVGHFKCNRRRLVDYPSLWAYTREIYQMPAVRGTVDFFHIKHHYYESHRGVNPTGIVPKGPELDLDAPHGRESLAGEAPQETLAGTG